MKRLLLLLVLVVVTGLAANQPQGMLGVLLGEITPQMKWAAGIPQLSGAVVQQVLPNGAGARAGLQPGDLIIGVDDLAVASPEDVMQRVGKHASGKAVGFVILRRDWQGRFQQFQLRPILLPATTGPVPVQPVPPSGSAIPPPSSRAEPARSTEVWLGIKFAGSALPLKVHFNQYRTCYAVAPADWFIYGHRREGDAVDIGAPDGSAASWFSLGVAGVAIKFYPQYATPETYLHYTLTDRAQGHNWHITYGQPMRDDLGYIWQPYEKDDTVPPFKGVVIYRVFPAPGDPLGYVLISRMIQTPKQTWELKGAQALLVGLSIRCNVQLRPSPDSAGRGRSDEDKEESTYNQQLGTEYAHNPETGDMYWMNRASDWHETGPDGPGYYIRSGNELKKLDPGLGR
ncbi:MAG: PDZ domain-containing protein [Acidobacteriia bacterium]|nr:PDZ domain-containing protein [Terriglobia bacterium]